MRRLVCLVGWLVVAGVGIPAGRAVAETTALLDSPRAMDVAVADGEVVVAAATSRNGIRLTAVPAAGGPARRLLSVPRPGRGWLVEEARVASSPQLTALLFAFVDPRGSSREWRVYSGPPSGELALVHRVRPGPRRRHWIPLDIDIHADRLLMQELRLPGGGFRATVLAPGAAPARVPQGRFGSPTALAGDDLAYVDVSGRADSPAFVRIVDWRTGGERRSISLGRISGDIDDRHLDLAEGGRVVAAIDGRLVAAAPGEPLQPVRGTRGRSGFTAPRFAGERLAALAGGPLQAQRPVLIDPRDGTLRAIGSRSTALDTLATGENTVAWLANGCVLAAGVDDQRPAGAPPPGAPPPGPCPRSEVVLEEGDQVLRGRTVRVRVTCVAAPRAGCRGAVRLGFGGRAGRGPFRLATGQRRMVGVGLTRRGLALVRRRVRRSGDAFLRLDARVVDGRVSRGAGTGGLVIDRLR